MNFHHLRYFWAVARDGSLTSAAKRLRVAQSALSTQIRQLEDDLGEPLFFRRGRGLVLTEAGEMARVYADEIFSTGDELVATLRRGRQRRHVLRVGAVATLSRNFQRSFVRPLLHRSEVRLRLSTGSFEELLAQLESHELDILLSNRAVPSGPDRKVRSRRLARQPVSVVSSVPLRGLRLPDDLKRHPMILPASGSELRTEFDALCERLGARPRIVAEVDDMATMRLIACDSEALVVVPSVVVRDELERGALHELGKLPEVAETFYATVIDRKFAHPLVRELLEREESDLLGPATSSTDRAAPRATAAKAKSPDGTTRKVPSSEPRHEPSPPTKGRPAARPRLRRADRSSG
jgi:LysR family transcriptional activator of nhaA